MPVFHLHIRIGNEIVPDLEGIDLPDLATARSEAVVSARTMMGDAMASGELNLDQSIEIHGSDDCHLATVEFGDTVYIRVSERRRLKIVPAT